MTVGPNDAKFHVLVKGGHSVSFGLNLLLPETGSIRQVLVNSNEFNRSNTNTHMRLP